MTDRTAQAIRDEMASTIRDDYPISPQQVGAFAATQGWIQWLDDTYHTKEKKR